MESLSISDISLRGSVRTQAIRAEACPALDLRAIVL